MKRLPILLLILAMSSPGLASARGFGQQPTLDWDRPEVPVNRHAEEVDFDNLTIEEKRKIQHSLEVRRQMVDIHTVMAFVSAGLIIGAEVVGIVNSTALEHGGILRSQLEPSLGLHRGLATGAIATYWTSGAIAWAMPPALKLSRQGEIKPKGVDSGELHAVLSIIHGIAMGTVIATGILQANFIPASDAWAAVESTHAIAGVTTAGTVIAAAIVIGTL